ncbi:glutathionyl-hydroquinone reductase YqjG isoform X3 [Nematostella vectensis]|nr:glutathionyl-hydroquinone reductase YqjG isoform X3 [Nematostella vectensis]
MDPVKQPGDSTFRFTDTKPGCDLDSVNNCNFLSDIYELARPGFKGRWTVPVLWDKKSKTIVNNESGDLLRMVGSEFNMFCPSEAMEKLDLYPEDLQPMIDDLNTWIQEDISIGVYRAGLAHDQGGYDKAVNTVFNAIEMIETILSRSRYLTGELLTEADIRLFSSLIRFDIAYYTMFMCNKKRLSDFPNTWRHTLDIYNMPGIADTVNLDHIKAGYWEGFPQVHPRRIVPVGPEVDLDIV